MTTLICIAVYLLGVIRGWWVTNVAHSNKHGRWYLIHPGIMDVVMVIFPFVNLGYWLISPYEDGYKDKGKIINKFFNIKK